MRKPTDGSRCQSWQTGRARTTHLTKKQGGAVQEARDQKLVRNLLQVVSLRAARKKLPKYPSSGIAAVPTRVALSKHELNSSQEVSEASIHAWHAAPLEGSVLACTPSEQSGSEEHHAIAAMASSKIGTRYSGSACRASPPRVPSESGDDVNTSSPAISQSPEPT